MSAADLPLARAAAAWNSPAFGPTLIAEIQALGPHDPRLRPLLQRALTQTSAVAEVPLSVQLLDSREETGHIRVHLGVFYAGIIAGCSCADDPSPVDTIIEHCEWLLDIDPATGRARATLCDH